MTNSPSADWKHWFIPGIIPMTLLEIAGERGLAAQDALASASIDITPSRIAESGLSFGQHLRLTQVVQEKLNLQALATEIGWRLPPTALGSVGYAILSSSTVREAIEILQRFWHLIGRASNISATIRKEISWVDIDVYLPITAQQQAMIKEISFVSMYRGVMAIAPAAAGCTEVWFDFPEPDHSGYLRERIGRVGFDRPSSQFRFPTWLLDTPLSMSNPVGLHAATQWCIREELERGLSNQRLSARLRAELKPGAHGYPSLDEMARRLGMAPRTLRRHLQLEGTRYSALVDAAQRREALRLLDNSRLTAHEVADLLGYVNAANFTRAFRRWTGQTPSQYRSRERLDDTGR